MGIASLLLGEDNPFAQWTNQNQNFLGAIGAGLGQGQNIQSGLSAGLAQLPQAKQLDQAAAAKQKAEKLAETQANASKSWMRANHPDIANMIDAGMPFSDGWKMAMQRLQPQQTDYPAEYDLYKLQQSDPAFADYMKSQGGGGQQPPATVQEWQYFNSLADDQKAQYLRMKRASPYLDIGTGFVQPDPLNPGQTTGGPIVKDNFTPAYDAAAGTAGAKVDVENQAALDSLASKLPGLKNVVGELSGLAKTATYTQTGQLIDNVMRETGLEPSEAAVARTKYIAMVDNQVLPLLRDTFGAAFTVKEGETLRATLGNPNVSPVEKQAILEAFIEQKVRDLDAMKSRAPGNGGGTAGGSKRTSTGVTYTVEP
jgi:hypothetical protein